MATDNLEKKIQTGLTTNEVQVLQKKYGKNELNKVEKRTILDIALESIKEPMFLLLIGSALVYTFIGEMADSILMFASVVGIFLIDVIQNYKTDKSLEALKNLASPRVDVIRNGKETNIDSAEVVPGDVLIIREGLKIPADCIVVEGNDLKVNESTLTGEPEGVWKEAMRDLNQEIKNEDDESKHLCFAGTYALQGSAKAVVRAIGAETKYGQIGAKLSEVDNVETPLQKQIAKLIKFSAFIAFGLMILIMLITFFNLKNVTTQSRIINSILSGITIAISMIPEEFPVILTVFLSMGAWRLSQKQALIRKLSSVETLGAVSVLCVDKTGTLTMNDMQVQKVWSPKFEEVGFAQLLGMACEKDAYDPMEQAMLEYCEKTGVSKEEIFQGEQVFDYSFSNELKMMGQAWKIDDQIVVAVKGSPENVIKLCSVTNEQQEVIEKQNYDYANAGMRVIALATTVFNSENDLPEEITDLKLEFCGLVALVDPPREDVREKIEICQKAGIRVVMITGDNGVTAKSIAKQVGINNADDVVTGKMLDELSDEELLEFVRDKNIFSRVTPEHKMRLISAFQNNGDVTAMLGDGVNDAPALKKSDIGVAMAKAGSDVSREAADLILLDDNFNTIVETIADGRRIYNNIKKTVGYIFIIHVPIAMAALLAPLLGIAPTALMILPIHVIILELIIDPTCAVVLEREPAPKNVMNVPPRDKNSSIITVGMFLKKVLQGFVIGAAAFGMYYWSLKNVGNEKLARTLGLSIIITSNLFLVHVVASGDESIFDSLKFYIKDKVFLLINLAMIIMYFALIYSPIKDFFKLQSLTLMELIMVTLIACISTIWVKIIPGFNKNNV